MRVDIFFLQKLLLNNLASWNSFMDTSGNMHPYKFVVFVNIFLLFGATSRAQQLPRPQDIDLDLINAKSLSPSGVKVNGKL